MPLPAVRRRPARRRACRGRSGRSVGGPSVGSPSRSTAAGDAPGELRVRGVDARVDDRHGGAVALRDVPGGGQVLARGPPLDRRARRESGLGRGRARGRRGPSAGVKRRSTPTERDRGVGAQARGEHRQALAGSGPHCDQADLRDRRPDAARAGARGHRRAGPPCGRPHRAAGRRAGPRAARWSAWRQARSWRARVPPPAGSRTGRASPVSRQRMWTGGGAAGTLAR